MLTEASTQKCRYQKGISTKTYFSSTAQTEEAFLIANNYCNVADKIEKTYGNCLVGYRAFAFDANMIYVADIEEYLKEARGIFNED